MSWTRSSLAGLCAVLLLTGCWDRQEVNDVAFVMVSSLDTGGKERYRQTLLIPLPGQLGGPTGGGGGTSGGQQPYYIDSATGNSIAESAEIMQKRMSRVLNFRHRRVVIVGEDLAKRGIRSVVDAIGRSPQHRLSSYLVIAKGRGEQLIAATPQLERFSGEAIREILSLTPSGRVNIKWVAQRLSLDGMDAVIPLFEAVNSEGPKPKPQVQAVGLALFSDDKMVGTAEGEEVPAMLWLVNRFAPHLETVWVRNEPVNIRVESGEVRLRLEKLGPPLQYRLRVRAEGGVMEDEAPGDLFDEQNLRKIELAWKQSLARRLEASIRKMQRLKCDGLGAGQLLNRTFPAEWEKRQDRWYEEFANSRFVVETEVQLRRMGQASGSISGEQGVEE